jgi:prefoldin subunit 5
MKRNSNSTSVPEREVLERQLESLQRDIRQLQLERDLVKKANEVLKRHERRTSIWLFVAASLKSSSSTIAAAATAG